MAELGNAVFQRGDLVAGGGLLIGQGVALHLKPLQHGGGNRLFLAQGRQGGVGLFARAGGLTGGGFGLRRGGDHAAQHLFGAQPGLIGLAPAAIEQQPFGMAQVFADGAVAGGLFGLTRQLRQLRGELFDHIVDAQQVGLGILELELGFVAALVEARNTGRLLEDATSVLGLGIDQLADLALTHQRRRMCAGRGIGKEHLHVAGAHILGVDLVGRADIAGDPAGDLQRIGIVETGRRQPVGIVEKQCHFGKVARRPRRSPSEDHVFHAAAAHCLGTGLPHHPAQRLEQVGFAAAVRPHHAGQPVLNQQVGRVDKALEACQTQF